MVIVTLPAVWRVALPPETPALAGRPVIRRARSYVPELSIFSHRPVESTSQFVALDVLVPLRYPFTPGGMALAGARSSAARALKSIVEFMGARISERMTA